MRGTERKDVRLKEGIWNVAVQVASSGPERCLQLLVITEQDKTRRDGLQKAIFYTIIIPHHQLLYSSSSPRLPCDNTKHYKPSP
ncbi:hypothetical protein VYU27_001271 [Nannochloropsis oceanica]